MHIYFHIYQYIIKNLEQCVASFTISHLQHSPGKQLICGSDKAMGSRSGSKKTEYRELRGEARDRRKQAMFPLFFSALSDPEKALRTHTKCCSPSSATVKTNGGISKRLFISVLSIKNTVQDDVQTLGILGGLKLGHEMRPRAIKSPGKNFTASVRDQQGVLELGGSLPVPRHCSPAIWPGFILPSTLNKQKQLLSFVIHIAHSL